MSRATIVVPCYNEAERLDLRQFEAFLRRTPGVGFLFVDDGSTDHTRPVLERLCGRSGNRCRFLGLPTNMGKGESVRRGILAALETPSDYVGFWDADLATPLEAIRTFCQVHIRVNTTVLPSMDTNDAVVQEEFYRELFTRNEQRLTSSVGKCC